MPLPSGKSIIRPGNNIKTLSPPITHGWSLSGRPALPETGRFSSPQTEFEAASTRGQLLGGGGGQTNELMNPKSDRSDSICILAEKHLCNSTPMRHSLNLISISHAHYGKYTQRLEGWCGGGV
ncbi:hypothetical protein CEXT_791771 [Caerostris extrusa]|uniref:Uncharacterized protein n=1 Tax=Caerostris extrusa TaxID=172846 RepID=A0AAV4V927_CAEEX|nr:hypothetical protein CEXT_791771 [Caerostris extrusa]